MTQQKNNASRQLSANKIVEDTHDAEFLVFNLGLENYAIDILSIQEIKSFSMLEITPVLNSPDYLVGMIKLHDRIIPLIDLRILYHLENKMNTDSTVVIIVNIANKYFGMVTDGVSHIAKIAYKDIKTASEVKSIIGDDIIQGVAAENDNLLVILDIEKLFTHSQWEASLYDAPH